jgi:hypothetical protein
MIFIKDLKKFWWELDKEKNIVFNYNGGFHDIKEEELKHYKTLECDSWHELYLLTGFCPLQEDIKCNAVWISPDGKFYDGDAHDCRAEDLLDILYGKESPYPGDRLEELGWIRATTSLMWEVREEDFKNKKLPQKQYDALFDWCNVHGKTFPKELETN